MKFLFLSLSRRPLALRSRATLFRRKKKKILLTVMYIRVQHEEFEMIYAPLCFAKSMIISWKLAVGEKIYNVFLDEAIQWMMDERGIEVMARLSKG